MRGHRWGTLAIVALLAVDLVLVVAAMWPTGAPAGPPAVPAAAVPGAASGSRSGSSSGSSSSSSAASPTSSASAAEVRAVPLTRLVAAVGSRVAWVVDTGTCTTAGRTFRTTDAGASWTSHRAPGSVTRVRPSSGDEAFVVGGGRGCAFALWSTRDGGASWAGPQSAQAAWGRSPKEAGGVQRPGGAPVTPCAKGAEVVDLTGVDRTTAAVLCADGAVRETRDGGATWSTTIQRSRALALSWDGGGSGLLAETSEGCAGVAVVAVKGGKAAEPVCVEGLTPSTGTVAISSSGGAVWIVAGDRAAVAAKPTGPWTVAAGTVG